MDLPPHKSVHKSQPPRGQSIFWESCNLAPFIMPGAVTKLEWIVLKEELITNSPVFLTSIAGIQ